ncbi:Dipeptide transport system permease protein DppB [subsurface metagenome]
MRAYIIRRLLLTIPTLLTISFLAFLVIRMMPGDVVDAMASLRVEHSGAGSSAPSSAETAAALRMYAEEIRDKLGLDEPVLIEYGRWMGFIPQEQKRGGGFSGIFQGNLGISLWGGEPVAELILPRLPVTLQLFVMSIIITYLVGLPIGIYSAVRQDTWGDYLGRSFAIMWLAVPGFWLATMVMVFPAIWWGWSPPIMLIPFTEDPIGNLKMFMLPALIMGLSGTGGLMRQTRTWMLEVLRQDYIRTAWGKGLKERVVLIRHAFRNTLIPIATAIGYMVPGLIAGAVIMENIFSLPGMGQLGITALYQRDFALLASLLLISAVLMVFGYLLSDIIYCYVDPRIRYK